MNVLTPRCTLKVEGPTSVDCLVFFYGVWRRRLRGSTFKHAASHKNASLVLERLSSWVQHLPRRCLGEKGLLLSRKNRHNQNFQRIERVSACSNHCDTCSCLPSQLSPYCCSSSLMGESDKTLQQWATQLTAMSKPRHATSHCSSEQHMTAQRRRRVCRLLPQKTTCPTDSVDTTASHRVSSQSNLCLKSNSRHKRFQRSTLTEKRSRPRRSDKPEPPHTVLLRIRKTLQRVDCKHDAHTSAARRSPQ